MALPGGFVLSLHAILMVHLRKCRTFLLESFVIVIHEVKMACISVQPFIVCLALGRSRLLFRSHVKGLPPMLKFMVSLKPKFLW